MEIWKEIKETDGKYLISNLGRVKSVNRKIKHKNGLTVNIKERILKLSEDYKGYLSANMYHNKRISIKIHRLVAYYFIENKYNLPQVNHIDFNKKNNYVENLEWIDNRKNITHYKNSIKSTSKYVGVHYDKNTSKFVAQINIEGVTYTLGRCNNEEDAFYLYKKSLYKWERKGLKPNIKRNLGYVKKDLHGNVIKYYKTLKDVKNDGYSISSVSMCVNGKYPFNNNKYKKFIWEREK